MKEFKKGDKGHFKGIPMEVVSETRDSITLKKAKLDLYYIDIPDKDEVKND